MASQKACKNCRAILDTGSKCEICGGTEFTDSFKGKVKILEAEHSEIAKNLKIKHKGVYAIKLG